MNRASTPFFTSVALAAASLKRSKTSGSTCSSTSAAALADVDGAIVGAAVVAAEVDAAGQAGGLQSAAQFVLVPALANLLLADERGFVAPSWLRAPSARASPLGGTARRVSRSIASLSATAQKTLLRSCWLRVRSSVAGPVEVLAVLGEMDVEHHVAIDDLSAMDGEAGLERLGVEERMRWLRLPERRTGPRSRCDARRRASG